MASKEEIIKLYQEGKSYRDIQSLTGAYSAQVASAVRGMRSCKEAQQLARSQGKGKLSDEGRLALSKAGQKACRRTGKYWTKPEQEFRKLLRSLGLGVRLPKALEEALDVESDSDASIAFQYPIQRYVCDFVDVNEKLVFRIHGDFWHANPVLYSEDQLTAIQRHNRKQDACCRRYLESKGWNVCDVWESELHWNVDAVKERIRATRKLVTPPPLQGGDAGFDPLVAHDWSEKLRELWFKKPRSKSKLALVCEECQKQFCVSSENKRSRARRFCCKSCSSSYYQKQQHASCRRKPDKEQLASEIVTESWCAIARKYGVTDNAVRKWAKGYGLI
jgi:very-short-patch-repair endonuclease